MSIGAQQKPYFTSLFVLGASEPVQYVDNPSEPDDDGYVTIALRVRLPYASSSPRAVHLFAAGDRVGREFVGYGDNHLLTNEWKATQDRLLRERTGDLHSMGEFRDASLTENDQ